MRKNIMDLADAVQTEINCEYCDNSFGSYSDVIDCAEAADEEGWIVNRAGKVKCPDCVSSTKRGAFVKNKKTK